MAAITVENIWKSYRLGERASLQADSFRSMLARTARGSLARLTGRRPPPAAEASREFWALKDVSFEVLSGQRVGIIGANGAGKSTLLKLLSRITMPTRGRITMRGRVGSLLEVGTGFHQDLTGRENIFLNGAILGMSRDEIRRRFDEIVAFADVEKFIDTPVKRYSSGMYVRLAFAVAAHLEPEILIIDEVLAVGDIQFQKKCLGKMESYGKEGRTVLFVSHNTAAITQMCTHALLMKGGQLVEFSDNVQDCVQKYLSVPGDQDDSRWENQGGEFSNPFFTPRSLAVTDGTGRALTGPISNDSDCWVRIEGDIGVSDSALTIGYVLYTAEGLALYWSYPTDQCIGHVRTLEQGRVVLRSQIPRRLLNNGVYRVALLGGLHFREWFFEPGQHVPSVHFTVEGTLSESPYFTHARPTTLSPVLNWEIEP